MTTTPMRGELTGDYVLDIARTRIGFAARHTIGPKVHGHFEEFEGSAHLDGDDPSQSSVKLTIRAGSFQTHNRQRDNLLRGRFLKTADHPTITFTSTGAQQVDETTFKLTGDLTIRGVTKPITVAFEQTGAEHDPRGDVRIRFKGGATINRKDWGVNWTAAAGLVGKKVALEIDVAAIRQT
ncbi:polyisoprenoid-binding protein [Planotetraspora silvatica]|uniref:Polyisoprenoid-binding protein n=1 Tax=Planotetraspora silvatica TaxID=234614 RepID=A0A8J3UUS2_9ACTN|nr:YceI family protein [Planotetraspora silvatica]GII50232.1 polyisoprenoid-binding protein [Planotetraspora silvatica]